MIIAQGAEAIIYLKGNKIIKNRVKKGYRIKEIDDKIRKQRTRREVKLLEKAGKVICVPKVFSVNEESKEIVLEKIIGKKLSDWLDRMADKTMICREIGENIAKLHDMGIIHGDLTTSNMIYSECSISNSRKNMLSHKNNKVSFGIDNNTSNGSKGRRFKVFFIDFGLGFDSNKIEDRAVDLHLIKEALEAKHFKSWEKLWKAVLSGYKISDKFKETMKRLEAVEKRGRYKESY